MKAGDVDTVKEEALELLKQGDLQGATILLDKALHLDFEDEEIRHLLMASKYWHERILKLNGLTTDFERAEAIITQWVGFLSYCKRFSLRGERFLFTFKQMAFIKALQWLGTYNTPEGSRNPEVLWRVGLCYKVLGNYEHAKKFLAACIRLNQNHAVALAELADVHALLNDPELAKLLFREAFFIDPQPIHLDTLESALIRNVIKVCQENGVDQGVLPFWIPVMGKLVGVFSITRELKTSEVGRIRQGIYSLEREYVEFPQKRGILIPNLLNYYFWYLDHAMQTPALKHEVQDYLLKIESLHPEVYKLYTR